MSLASIDIFCRLMMFLLSMSLVPVEIFNVFAMARERISS